MAEAPIIEFAAFRLTPAATIEQEGTEAYKTWQGIRAILRDVPGIKKQYTGRQLEDPSTLVHVIVWATAADQPAFQSSPAYGPFLQSLRSLADPDNPAGVETARLVSPEVELSAALDAPCTEVFTAYGAEPAFPGAVAAFAAAVAAAPPPPYRGAAVCDSAGEIEGLGRVVKLVVGWESREAHLEAKGKPGPISDNIQLLREGKKSGKMYHVQLKAL